VLTKTLTIIYFFNSRSTTKKNYWHAVKTSEWYLNFRFVIIGQKQKTKGMFSVLWVTHIRCQEFVIKFFILERENKVLPHVTWTQLKASILVYLVWLYNLKVWILLFRHSIRLCLLFYLKHTKQWTVFVKLGMKCISLLQFYG
jgi:hypothetical protein